MATDIFLFFKIPNIPVFRLFDVERQKMCGCQEPGYGRPKTAITRPSTGRLVHNNMVKLRLISTGRLNPLRGLHLQPINLVVYKVSLTLSGQDILSQGWLPT